jgi:hypothetical protein
MLRIFSPAKSDGFGRDQTHNLGYTLDGSATADDNEAALMSYNSETYVSETLIW